MTPLEYLNGFHNGSIDHLLDATADKGFTISRATLRRGIIGEVMPTKETFEAWEDFTGDRVGRQDLIDQHLKFLAEKE